MTFRKTAAKGPAKECYDLKLLIVSNYLVTAHNRIRKQLADIEICQRFKDG